MRGWRSSAESSLGRGFVFAAPAPEARTAVNFVNFARKTVHSERLDFCPDSPPHRDGGAARATASPLAAFAAVRHARG
jgi:hypothetical protein